MDTDVVGVSSVHENGSELVRPRQSRRMRSSDSWPSVEWLRRSRPSMRRGHGLGDWTWTPVEVAVVVEGLIMERVACR